MPRRLGRWGLNQEQVAVLGAFPIRADFPNLTDPFKYRLMEVIGVYGDSLREMANEMFGDGSWSAIDFTLDMEKVTGSQEKPVQDYAERQMARVQDVLSRPMCR